MSFTQLLGVVPSQLSGVIMERSPANVHAGHYAPGGVSVGGGGLLQYPAGQAEDGTGQLHWQVHYTMPLQEGELQEVPSHPHYLAYK